MTYEYKIGELTGEVRDGAFRVARITPRGRKTTTKVDVDNEEYAQPEVWLAACEAWLNLVGKQGWQLVTSEVLGEYHVRYTLVKGEQGAAGKPPAKDKTMTQQLTEQVAGHAVKSVLKIP